MAAETLTPTEMRIILILVGLIVLALIYWFGKPGRREQGRRSERPAGRRVEPVLGGDELVEPSAPDHDVGQAGIEPVQSELDVGAPRDRHHSPVLPRARQHAVSIAQSNRPLPGRRPDGTMPERIVSLMVVTRDDNPPFHGPDIVVAAEKTGLVFGDMGIFHRLLDGKPALGPIFSAANMVEPGDFDMSTIQELETPGLNLFMTLPGPIPALDGWDTMLPTARRLAELLDGRVVDDQRNALGRQRVAYIRDELRAWDRKHQASL